MSNYPSRAIGGSGGFRRLDTDYLVQSVAWGPGAMLDAATLMVSFVRDHEIDILNVAGPRETEWAGGYAYAFRAVDVLLSSVKVSGRR